jgi:hypothetical protein
MEAQTKEGINPNRLRNAVEESIEERKNKTDKRNASLSQTKFKHNLTNLLPSLFIEKGRGVGAFHKMPLLHQNHLLNT